MKKKVGVFVRRWESDPDHCGWVNFYPRPRSYETMSYAQLDHDTFIRIFGVALKPGVTYELKMKGKVRAIEYRRPTKRRSSSRRSRA